MRAVVTTALGEAPTVADFAAPSRPAGTTLVQMVAAAVNPVDLAIAAGRFYLPVPDPPRVAGAEAVGTVVASDVHPAGTMVWVLQPTGCFAEQVVVADEAVVPVPEGVDPVLAAALGIAGLAGWMPVLDRGGLRTGETVVVLGATGIAGRVALRAARHGGAGRVVAVGRNAAVLDELAAHGADEAVTLGDPSGLTAELGECCPGGVDLVIDALWGTPLVATLPVLARGGRVVQVGSAAGQSADVVAGPLRGGRIDIRGFSVFSEPAHGVSSAYAAMVTALGRDGEVVPIERVALDDAADAFAAQAAGGAAVKRVLIP